MPSRKIILSGVQPTSGLHLGNYLGALRSWVPLQDAYDCYFVAVDLHSITLRQDPAELRTNTYGVLAAYLASGIDAKKSTLFVQSHVPQHAELGWVLTCFSNMGELNRMTQFKDKSAKQTQSDSIPTGLFVYPTLMAADILVYRAHLVPTGEDQKQHLELARDLAERMNKFSGKNLLPIPDPYIPPAGGRVMSLLDPDAKMSKSDPNPNATIFLADDDDTIRKKFKRSVTDSKTGVEEGPVASGVTNLFSIQAAIDGKTVAEIHKSYVGRQYGYLKLETAEKVVSALAPVRTEMQRLLGDRSYLDGLLQQGAEKARAKAEATLADVYDCLGFIPRR